MRFCSHSSLYLGQLTITPKKYSLNTHYCDKHKFKHQQAIIRTSKIVLFTIVTAVQLVLRMRHLLFTNIKAKFYFFYKQLKLYG